MKKKNFIWLLWIFGAVIIIGFAVQLYNSYYLRPHNKKLIRDDKQIINGAKIMSVIGEAKVSELYNIKFAYEVKNVEYTNEVKIGTGLKPHAGQYLSKKFVPIVYEQSNPQNSFVLITLADFDYFGIPFPDTLQWIKEDVLK